MSSDPSTQPPAPRSAGPPSRRRLPSAEAVRAWGRWIQALLILSAAALAFAADYVIYDLHVRDELKKGGLPAGNKLAWIHPRLTGLATVTVPILAWAAALWLIWQYMAHRWLRARHSKGLRFRPAAAVVSWAVPLANLALPALAVDELLRASAPESDRTGRVFTKGTILVSVWWLLWLSTGTLAILGMSNASGLRTLDDFILRDRYFLAAALIGIGAAGMGFWIIHEVGERQAEAENRDPSLSWTDWPGR